MKRKSCHVVGLLLLLGLLSCREPASEPEFRAFIDSADIFVRDVDGKVLRFDAQDCVWGVNEFEDLNEPYSYINIFCGAQKELHTAGQRKGSIFSEYRQDTSYSSSIALGSFVYIRGENWPWPSYAEQENCRHAPEDGAVVISSSSFDIQPADDVTSVPEGFDAAYKVKLFYKRANPMLDEPCFQLEVQGGYFVKY